MTAASERIVHRVVFPADRDLDVLPLYVDEGLPPQPDPVNEAKTAGTLTVMAPKDVPWHPDDVISRRSMRVRAGERLSLASYFGAFPAAYWRRWTTVESVALSVRTEGAGTVVVYKSNALGLSQRIDSRRVEGTSSSRWDLTLAPFGDGGWYWFDLIADEDGMVLAGAEYSVASDAPSGRLTLGTTTYNRADYCVQTIAAIAADEDLLDILDEFVVVDQGTDRVRDRPEYPELQERLGTQLKVIEQGNLGGSGGFSRNMVNALESGTDYLMLLDDDILVETEGILRAAAFADFCRLPTIVGGHMFDLHARSILHAWSESVTPYTFDWGVTEGLTHRHDFAQRGLRQSPELHKRWDADYNGWWMCLIPRTVIETIGLSLPVFIKWDDAEYSLRARAQGFPTISLPGAAVWHVSWLDKDDSIDWQAYFHLRNRIVAALLHSPFDHGGAVLVRCLATDVKHIFGMQRYATEARIKALEDVLSGPAHLHATIGTRAAELRAAKSAFPDATYKPHPNDFPIPGRAASRISRRGPKQPSFGKLPLWLLKTAYRQLLTPAAPESRERPEAVLAKQDATWWRMAAMDSALVSNADGTGTAWHQRDHRETRRSLQQVIELYLKIHRRWDELAADYRAASEDFVSPEAWKRTFSENGPA